jgi:quinol monooxygenase YgiN
MSNVSVIVKIPVVPGKRDEFAQAFEQAITNAKAEAGTLHYVLHADGADENAVWVTEIYADQAALDAHMGSDEFKALMGTLTPFIGGAPEFTFAKPLTGKGI